MSRELLFSVTADDCRFDYYRGTGKGGQKRNKTSSAVRCTHKESSAVGQSDDTRSQHENKQIAFRRMAETPEFKRWHRAEILAVTGQLAAIDQSVNDSLVPSNLRIEGKDSVGKWIEI